MAAQQHTHQARGPRWGLIIAGVLGVIVLAVASVFAWDYLSRPEHSGDPKNPAVTNGDNATITIPNLEGEKADQAIKKLEGLGLVVSPIQQASPTIDRGSVIAIDPGPGSTVQTGTSVTVTVSSGTEEIAVPDVTGRTTDAARQILEKADLVLDSTVRETNSDDVPAGEVIEQKPPAGEKIPKGSEVTITVSTGPGSARIPDLEGLNWQRAERNLKEAGLEPIPQFIDSQRPENEVVEVEGAGKETTRGTTVIVKVSNGTLITTPDLTGMTARQALSALRAAGWTAPDTSLVQQLVDSPSLVDNGLIAAQTPLPEEPLRKDGLVSVRVNNFNPLAVLR